jgi:hypothetical protein
MRMIWISLILLLAALPNSACAEGNFTLTINGQTVDLNLDTEQKLRLPNGTEVSLTLARKANSNFTTKGLAFEYPGNLNVATSEIDKNTYQHMMASALGTVILVQTYPDLDATQLVDLMTGKMTDEDVAGGDQRETLPHSRTLADGTVVKGTRSTLKGPGDDAVVEVLGIRQGQGGTMLITRFDRDTAPEEEKIIERFWATLNLR